MPKSRRANLAALTFVLAMPLAILVLIVFAHALWPPWGGWVVATCYIPWFVLLVGGWRRDWYDTTPEGKAFRKQMAEASTRWRAQVAEREAVWLAETPDDWVALIAIGKGLKAVPGGYPLVMFLIGLLSIGGVLVGVIATIFAMAIAVVWIAQAAGVTTAAALWIFFAICVVAALALWGAGAGVRRLFGWGRR